MIQHRYRQPQAPGVVVDVVGLFDLDGYTPIGGVVASDVRLLVWSDGQSRSWDLVDGSVVTNAQVTSGHVYWSASGNYYVLRWRPDVVGSWQMLLDYPDVPQLISLCYDFRPEPVPAPATVAFG